LREFQNRQAASRLQYTPQFSQTLFDARQVPEGEANGHRVEGRVPKGKTQRVSFDESQAGRFLLCELEHRTAKIHSHHAGRSLFKYRNAQIPRAASDVEHSSILSQQRLQLFDDSLSPTPVDVRRKQMIQQIVSGRDPREHFAHPPSVIG
jgi:hypothetical protein